jgi:hypothetical protein
MEDKKLLTLKKALNTVSESLVYKNKNYKPKITMGDGTVKFTVNIHEIVNSRTKQELQKRYTPVYKKIFESVRQELIDNGANYLVGFTLKESDLRISKGKAGGARAKVEVVYEQTWNYEFINKANTIATF